MHCGSPPLLQPTPWHITAVVGDADEYSGVYDCPSISGASPYRDSHRGASPMTARAQPLSIQGSEQRKAC